MLHFWIEDALILAVGAFSALMASLQWFYRRRANAPRQGLYLAAATVFTALTVYLIVSDLSVVLAHH